MPRSSSEGDVQPRRIGHNEPDARRSSSAVGGAERRGRHTPPAMSDGKSHSSRPAAWGALAAAAVLVAALVALVLGDLTGLLLVLALLSAAGAAGWVAVTRRGRTRMIGLVCAVAAVVGAVVALIALDLADELLVVVIAGVVFAFAGRMAVRQAGQAQQSAARPPARPRAPAGGSGRVVLLMNPRSGGGKVKRFDLVNEATRRGIRPVLLEPGDDLRELARDAAASAD